MALDAPCGRFWAGCGLCGAPSDAHQVLLNLRYFLTIEHCQQIPETGIAEQKLQGP
jgi:hypothetical protein